MSGHLHASAHSSRRLLTLDLKTCSLSALITMNSSSKREQVSHRVIKYLLTDRPNVQMSFGKTRNVVGRSLLPTALRGFEV
jgi:hypothetical protein